MAGFGQGLNIQPYCQSGVFDCLAKAYPCECINFYTMGIAKNIEVKLELVIKCKPT